MTCEWQSYSTFPHSIYTIKIKSYANKSCDKKKKKKKKKNDSLSFISPVGGCVGGVKTYIQRFSPFKGGPRKLHAVSPQKRGRDHHQGEEKGGGVPRRFIKFILTISPSRSVRCETKTHQLCGCASKVIPKNSKRDTIKVFKPIVKRKEKNRQQKAHSLSHTKWMCKYHIVFTPKYRRKVIYNQYRSSLGKIFHRLCSYKGVEIIEGSLNARSCTYVSKYSTKDKCFEFHGLFKRKKCTHDVWQTRQSQDTSLGIGISGRKVIM